MVQASDVLMRVCAIGGGFVGIVESILIIVGSGLMPWNFGWISIVIGILLAIAALALGIKPVHYTPLLLGIICVGLIILGILFGGIIVLVATIFGALS